MLRYECYGSTPTGKNVGLTHEPMATLPERVSHIAVIVWGMDWFPGHQPNVCFSKVGPVHPWSRRLVTFAFYALATGS